MQYITFAEYQDLGGTVTEEATFNSLQRTVEAKMNYLTFGRIEKLYDEGNLPSEVEILEVELINTFSNDDTSSVKTGVQSYSNGIESITYAVSKDNIEKQRNERVFATMQEYLFKYPELFYRGTRRV